MRNAYSIHKQNLLKHIEEFQGSVYDEKLLVPGQVPIGVLNHYLQLEQEFVVTGRIRRKFQQKGEKFVLKIEDATGKMLLTASDNNLSERCLNVLRLVTPEDLVMAKVESFERSGGRIGIRVNDIYCVGVNFKPLIRDRDEYSQKFLSYKSVVKKAIRAFLYQHGCMEIDSGYREDQRLTNLYYLVIGCPKIFSFFKGENLLVTWMHSDAEVMRRLLQLMINSIQQGISKEAWKLPFSTYHFADVFGSHPPDVADNEVYWMDENPNSDGRKPLYSKLNSFGHQEKFTLMDKRKRTLGWVESNNTSPFFTKVERFDKPYNNLLKNGVPPFATMSFDIYHLIGNLIKYEVK